MWNVKKGYESVSHYFLGFIMKNKYSRFDCFSDASANLHNESVKGKLLPCYVTHSLKMNIHSFKWFESHKVSFVESEIYYELLNLLCVCILGIQALKRALLCRKHDADLKSDCWCSPRLVWTVWFLLPRLCSFNGRMKLYMSVCLYATGPENHSI